MASKSDFLSLTLPAFNEFLDSWGDVNNQNFETIDDWLSGLRVALSGASIDDWGTLTGDFTSLVDRLAVSINADGTVRLLI